MRYRVALLGLMVLGAACGSSSAPLPTTPSVSPVSAPPTLQALKVGEDFTGHMEIHGSTNSFELTAPSDGTLELRVTWLATQGRLELWLGDALASQADSPIVANLAVVAGRKYVVRVGDYAAWDDGAFSLSYVLATAIR